MLYFEAICLNTRIITMNIIILCLLNWLCVWFGLRISDFLYFSKFCQRIIVSDDEKKPSAYFNVGFLSLIGSGLFFTE